jgi:hypothetical protein
VSDSLQPWFDPGLTVAELNPDEIALAERERLLVWAVTAQAASTMKRRLGPDATREEIATDKKISRKIAFFTLNLAHRWGESAHEIPRNINAIAAQVNWEWWLEDKIATSNERKQWIATWAIRFGYKKDGRIFLSRLKEEEGELLRIQSYL